MRRYVLPVLAIAAIVGSVAVAGKTPGNAIYDAGSEWCADMELELADAQLAAFDEKLSAYAGLIDQLTALNEAVEESNPTGVVLAVEKTEGSSNLVKEVMEADLPEHGWFEQTAYGLFCD